MIKPWEIVDLGESFFVLYICLGCVQPMFHIYSLLHRNDVLYSNVSQKNLDSSSDVVLFDYPPVNRPWPRVQQAESEPRTNKTNATVTTESAGTSASSSQGNRTASNGASARVAMQGFVYGRTMSGIWSPAHGSALISILQIAGVHENGLLGSLGHGHTTAWINQNWSALLQVGGPLHAYHELSATVLMRHLSDAESKARAIYDCSHSNNPTGAEHEDIHQWAHQFFCLFEAQDSHLSALALANEVRRERTNVVRSLVGAQAPPRRWYCTALCVRVLRLWGG
jgi:hypothetical protein